MNTSVLDATDMSCFADDSFDIVSQYGTILSFDYRRAERKMHEGMSKSVKERRAFGYCVHSKILCFQYIATSNEKYLDEHLAKQLIETGVLKHDDEKCFWDRYLLLIKR